MPHRPLTAPGAHSTLNFTRIPVETASPSRERSTAQASSKAAVLPAEATPRDGSTVSPPRVTASTAVEEPVHVAIPDPVAPVDHEPAAPIEQEPAHAVEPPEHELVPDVPLDEYVQNFHYDPPTDAAEVTMRGDAPVADQRVSASPAASADQAASVAADASEPSVAAPTDTESRLGLEAEAPSEVATERPRFLDLGEPAAESQPATSGTSTIVGPSFLGLSDAPEVAADIEALDGEEAPRKSHWRGWAAAGIVVIFAGLALMEWRSQSHQTENGPVEVIKAKVRNWTKGSASQSGNEGATASSTSDNSKPDMQVQEQPKPQADQAATPQNQAANSGSGATPPSPGATSAPAAAQTTPPPSEASTPPKPAAAPPPAAQNTPAASKSQTTTQAATASPKPDRKADKGADDTAAAKATAGSDELTKARNASDSAAEAAWLWKATAKGNPDAPVMLADMYMKGDGVPRSCEQAVVLLKTAAEKENARARNRLASMYATGNCVQRNRVEAYRWLSSALTANPHSDWAQQNKDLIWQQMTPDERAEAQKYR